MSHHVESVKKDENKEEHEGNMSHHVELVKKEGNSKEQANQATVAGYNVEKDGNIETKQDMGQIEQDRKMCKQNELVRGKQFFSK